MAGKYRNLLVAAGTAIATLVAFAPAVLSSQSAGAAASQPVSPTVIYDATSTPLIPMYSLGFEATQASEAGNLVQFAGTSRRLTTVTVTMDSWGCESGGGDTCLTTPGATFSEPITFNLYKAGAGNSVGSLITSVSKTFQIPYRPSADPTDCPDGQTFLFGGECVHGLPNNISFPISDVVAPSTAIWSVAYDTSGYGADPYGYATACAMANDCGYDSLNVGLLDADGPSVGSDPLPGTIYWNTQTAADYCDGGTDGTGTFRLDSADDNGAPCWGDTSPYTSAPWLIPAAQFTAVPEISVSSSNTTTHLGQLTTFTVSAPPTATGSVTLESGPTPFASCTLSSGSCHVNFGGLGVGARSISAVYGGDGSFPAFTSASIIQNVSPIHPSAPVSPVAVPNVGTAAVSWSPPTNLGGSSITGYKVSSVPGGFTCATSGATTCTVTGLTDGTPYTFAVTATNVAGTGPASISRSVTPATTGFHVYAVPPVIEVDKAVTVSATGAQANSLLTLSIPGHGSKNVFADAYGAAFSTFHLYTHGSFSIGAKNSNSTSTARVYVAKVNVASVASHRHQIPVTVKSAIPGSVLVVSTSTDGTFSVPVPSSGKVTVDLPKSGVGTLHVTVTDDGFFLVQRAIAVQ